MDDVAGLRVVYYWWEEGLQFWLFTLYDKGVRTPQDISKRFRDEVLEEAVAV